MLGEIDLGPCDEDAFPVLVGGILRAQGGIEKACVRAHHDPETVDFIIAGGGEQPFGCFRFAFGIEKRRGRKVAEGRHAARITQE